MMSTRVYRLTGAPHCPVRCATWLSATKYKTHRLTSISTTPDRCQKWSSSVVVLLNGVATLNYSVKSLSNHPRVTHTAECMFLQVGILEPGLR
ncbi:hypothetical protein AC579_10325 [Pseudocercospora musae]|uniref:Uncharacterized protein n=1 Tax=Pseudocercospora musae TaxID=113226 RepID=A0A139I9X5_9PEZI|nr:hypothetical protein AC579_10325 [Pseudocercospora musae]